MQDHQKLHVASQKEHYGQLKDDFLDCLNDEEIAFVESILHLDPAEIIEKINERYAIPDYVVLPMPGPVPFHLEDKKIFELLRVSAEISNVRKNKRDNGV